MSTKGSELRLRITVVRPIAGVILALQRGRDELQPPTVATAGRCTFDFTVRVAPGAGAPNFLGEFTQGPKSERFVYVNSGVRAGQIGTCWDRRAKVSLMSISRAQVAGCIADPALRLEARIEGRARDGGPMCATVPLLGGGWKTAAGVRRRVRNT